MAAVRLSVLEVLSVLGDRIRVAEPTGAFYVFIEVPNTALSDMALIQRLIEDYQVAVVPGQAFGVSDRCSLRVSYGALRTRDVLNGMGRLVDGLGQLI
jgi:aspartate/methionine/tyrosine aminotransferase